ncbi:MAG TPA: TadE family type IV pilus minor pilin [Streptomyces sp.]|nr:TadE family type IV pilus minor pilin [Streptomyces sp.]
MTAEAALALPVLVMVTALLVSGLIAVLMQIQCVDAARSGARAAARQDPAGRVVAVARGIAPRGATVTVSREESQVRVVVVVKTPLPFDLRAEAVADAEEATDAVREAPGTGEATGAGAASGAVPDVAGTEASGTGHASGAGEAARADETPGTGEATGAGGAARAGAGPTDAGQPDGESTDPEWTASGPAARAGT